MNQIARCDCYPSGQDGAILPVRNYQLYSATKIPRKTYNKPFIDQACSLKMAGYWPRSPFESLWTSPSSGSKNTQKKNLENIQPSWPHTRSITRMSTLRERNLKRHFLYKNVSTERVFSTNYAGEFKNETITLLAWCFRFRKAPFRKCFRSTLECKGVAFKSSGLKSVFEMLRIHFRDGFV